MTRYDIIIVGAGAAGLTAALYATRRKLTTLVLSRDLGGQTASTMDIENYPGVDSSTGPDLMERFATQARKFGAEIKLDGIASVTKTADGFEVSGDSGTVYQTKTIVLAFGKSHRHLDVMGEQKFLNRGVVYCATCDAPLFDDKPVAVIGGGNAAMDAAVLLSKIASKIYLVHRREDFNAEAVMAERVRRDPKVELVLNASVKEIKGDQLVSSIIVTTPNGDQELPVEGVFVEIGQTVKTEFLNGLVELNSAGEIVINAKNSTSCAGIFAAGDVTTVPYKQTVIAAGEGAKAALAAYDYLQKQNPDLQSSNQGYIK